MVFAVSLAVLPQSKVAAGGMTKNVEQVRPRVGQQGTTVDVAIRGTSIENPRKVVFYHPGIKAINIQPVQDVDRPRNLAHRGRIAQEVRCQFEISPDCPPGEYAFRLLTATELTCIGTFHVTPFQIVPEEEPNNAYSNDTLETAKSVKGNVTIYGEMSNGKRPDRDIYRIDAMKGQRLSIEVQSARIADVHYADSQYDLAVRVFNASGKVIAQNDDNSLHIQDPLLSVMCPEDGPVYVEVSRSVYMGAVTEYCLHLGDYRRPLAAFPPGGQAGVTTAIQFLGDSKEEYTETVSIPENLGSFTYFGESATPMKLRSSPYPNFLEHPDKKENIVEELPAALNGILAQKREVDRYRLSVKKGGRYIVRVYAAALGSPIDPLLRIRPVMEDGTLGDAEVDLDDSPIEQHDIFGANFRSKAGLPETIDPSLVWNPKVTGEYVVEISDPSNFTGPTSVYRIEIEPPRTIVHTVLQSKTFDWTESMRVTGMAIPRGSRWSINIGLPNSQWNSPKSEFNLVARGLPEGVRMYSPPIKPGTSTWPVQFEADNDAELTGTVFSLVAVSVENGELIETYCQQNVPFVNHSGGDAWRTVSTDRYMLAVTDPAPFSINVDSSSVTLVRDGESAVPVRVTRHGEFNGPVLINVGYADRYVGTPPPVIVPAEESVGLVRLSVRGNAPLGETPLVLQGSNIRDDIDPYLGAGHVRVSSEFVKLRIAEPYVKLASQPASVRRGEVIEFPWTVSHENSFIGTARVELKGLPKGVEVVEPYPEITNETEKIYFSIEATDDALLGLVEGLSCEILLTDQGQQVVQRSGRGSIRIDPRL
ncbi:hypothetical protein V22_21840 [Calycomorphotria hydatis]|uniref:Serine protease n=2 Tax=Calycomorphotria hydatis TaxID=2528027 RepID=A0A517T9A9_9PLAN|nr:hypothetical protein V22_21840 [Calycomorphotria hydatis]